MVEQFAKGWFDEDFYKSLKDVEKSLVEWLKRRRF